VVGPRASCRNQFVTNATWKGQIGDGAVQMPQFSPTQPEFNPAETMIVCRHTFPTSDDRTNCVDR